MSAAQGSLIEIFLKNPGGYQILREMDNNGLLNHQEYSDFKRESLARSYYPDITSEDELISECLNFINNLE
jgi:hypothetical protein